MDNLRDRPDGFLKDILKNRRLREDFMGFLAESNMEEQILTVRFVEEFLEMKELYDENNDQPALIARVEAVYEEYAESRKITFDEGHVRDMSNSIMEDNIDPHVIFHTFLNPAYFSLKDTYDMYIKFITSDAVHRPYRQ